MMALDALLGIAALVFGAWAVMAIERWVDRARCSRTEALRRLMDKSEKSTDDAPASGGQGIK